jgi:hypothetical protein
VTDSDRCQAVTIKGTQCKNTAKPDSRYCYIHYREELEEESAPSAQESNEFEQVIGELNQLVSELRSSLSGYAPPPFSATALMGLLKQNLDKFTPEMRLSIVTELQESLEGAKPQDFLDPETWKGLWFLLNYQVQSQTEPLRDMLKERLGMVPGAALVGDIADSLEGAQPRDFLDLETWKGLWFLVNYQIQAQTEELRGKFRGAHDE